MTSIKQKHVMIKLCLEKKVPLAAMCITQKQSTGL